MNRQSSNKIVPEQLEFEELTKKMRITTAKLRVAQEGVETSSLSKQNLDKIMRIYDEMEHIQRDAQQKNSKIQQEANMQSQKINQDTSKRMMDTQKKYQDLITSLKKFDIEDQTIQTEEIIQEVEQEEKKKEKAYEEKVSEITDIILRQLRGHVYEKVDEIMKTIDFNAETVIGRGEIVEELEDNTKQMTVESSIDSANISEDKNQ